MPDNIKLKSDTSLVGVRERESGFPVRVYDDGDGPLWVYATNSGPWMVTRMVIRAQSFEDAYSIAIDESTTIAESDVPEAYGFDGPNGALELRHATERAEAGLGEYPDLQEGYQYQDNASGTGIVWVGYHESLRELTRDEARERYRVLVTSDDVADPERVTFELESYAYTMTVRGKTKRFRNLASLDGVGARLRKLERAIGPCAVEWSHV